MECWLAVQLDNACGLLPVYRALSDKVPGHLMFPGTQKKQGIRSNFLFGCNHTFNLSKIETLIHLYVR